VIHNGIAPIPLNDFVESPVFDHCCFNVGVVGRIDRVKGHIFLLKALEMLSDLEKLQLHILGRGPLEYELKEYCISHGLNSRVRFWGFHEDIHRYMFSLDILVVPSLSEGLPYTVLEAMYLRVPIIGSAVGGLREILESEQNALLVPPRDHERLARSIRRLHDDLGLREKISRRAFLDVTSRFMMDKLCRRYIEVYREAMVAKR